MAHILVVDDEQSIRVTLREFLRDADYEVGVAEDADQERGRLLLLKARSDRRKDLAKAERTRVRAKAAAKEKIATDRRQAEEQHRRNARSWAQWRLTGGRMPRGL